MPPKPKFTREEIAAAALRGRQQEGHRRLTIELISSPDGDRRAE